MNKLHGVFYGSMARTIEELELHVPHVLALLVGVYLAPVEDDDYDIGLSGFGELCDSVIDWAACLEGMCEGDYEDLIFRHIAKHDIVDWTSGIRGVCRGGYRALVEMMTAKANGSDGQWHYDINEGLVGACEGGHLDMIDLVVGQVFGAHDFNAGLEAACRTGNGGAVGAMVKHGARDWDRGLVGACKGGWLTLAELMISYGASANAGLAEACRLGDCRIARSMIKAGATDVAEGLIAACCNNRCDVAEFMMTTGVAADYGLHAAVRHDCAEAARLMIDHGASNIDYCIYLACLNGYREMAKLLVESGAGVKNGLAGACESGNISMMKMMIAYGACDWNYALEYTCDVNGKGADHYAILKMLLDLGADNYHAGINTLMYDARVHRPDMISLLEMRQSAAHD